MPAPTPPYEKSTFITDARIDWTVRTQTGDMWPATWADDGNLYLGAGDNHGTLGKDMGWSPMNVWRAAGDPKAPDVEVVNHLPVDPKVYCRGENVDHDNGVKPAGLIQLNGVLYMAVENINYGDRPDFNRQHNINGWILASKDYGRTWEKVTDQYFFTGRVASCHFLQAGQADGCVLDGYVWAYFPCGLESDDSWWCCGDGMLLGRVKPEDLLNRGAWEFYAGQADGAPVFSPDDQTAVPVFTFMHFTGENHVSYNPYLKRYLMGNYAFYDPATGAAQPYHTKPWRAYETQLTLYEAEHPWGPWKRFYQEDQWLTGGYQPCFPVNWMAGDGQSMVLLGSGNDGDYCFVTQEISYRVDG